MKNPLVDGDQLNAIQQPIIVTTALNNLAEYNIHTLHYEMGKADPQLLNLQNMFKGLKRAHDYSGIGAVSNSLTKLWNSQNPDLQAADWLSCYNNFVIDAAKTGRVNSYESYPEVKKKISKATGGKNGKMPFFFQYSKNGRRQTQSNLKKKKNNGYAPINSSTMNRICSKFDDIGIIDFNKANIAEFNPLMLLSQEDWNQQTNQNQFDQFYEISKTSGMIATFNLITPDESYGNKHKNDIVKQYVQTSLIQQFGSLEACYPSIVKLLFEKGRKSWNKGMFWNIFGQIAQKKLLDNLSNCHRCEYCNMIIPNWSSHECDADNRYICIDCGKTYFKTNSRNHKNARCPQCSIIHKKQQSRLWHLQKYQKEGKK